MKNKIIWILSIDPSGNFKEGKGITGIVLAKVDKEAKKIITMFTNTICAKDFETETDYYESISNGIKDLKKFHPTSSCVVIENFTLHKHKALYQSGSEMETVKLIGHLQEKAKRLEIPYYMQLAGVVKPAMLNKHLEQDGLIYKHNKSFWINPEMYGLHSPLTKHELDAVRHLNYFVWCNKEFRGLSE